MRMIHESCRNRFTEADYAFAAKTLCKDEREEAGFGRLWVDEEARDQILDNEALLRALLDQPAFLTVSTAFYFYVLVRHSLCRAGFDDREVADYVAGVLEEFSLLERIRKPLVRSQFKFESIVETLAAVAGSDKQDGFLLRLHLGNYTLFLSGIFPEHIEHRRERRAAPRIEYYESIGQTNYRLASDHPLSRHYSLSRVLGCLAEGFRSTRLALNGLSSHLLFLGDSEPGPADGEAEPLP